jgi:hypothetical protein
VQRHLAPVHRDLDIELSAGRDQIGCRRRRGRGRQQGEAARGRLHPHPPERAHHRQAKDRADVVAAGDREGELGIVDDQEGHVAQHRARNLQPVDHAEPHRDIALDAVADAGGALDDRDAEPPRRLGGEDGEAGAGVEHRLLRLAVHRDVDPRQADPVGARRDAALGDLSLQPLRRTAGEQGRDLRLLRGPRRGLGVAARRLGLPEGTAPARRIRKGAAQEGIGGEQGQRRLAQRRVAPGGDPGQGRQVRKRLEPREREPVADQQRQVAAGAGGELPERAELTALGGIECRAERSLRARRRGGRGRRGGSGGRAMALRRSGGRGERQCRQEGRRRGCGSRHLKAPRIRACRGWARHVHRFANKFFRITITNGCQAMSELPTSIRASARRLRYAALATIALFELVLLLAVWLLLAGGRDSVPALQIRDSGLPPWAAAASLLLIGLLVGLALLRLVRMLARVEAGAPFAAAGDLRGFAFYLLLAVLVSVFAPALFGLVAQAQAGADHRLELALGSTELLALLVSALLFFVARLLDEAQRLADDHSQIV